MRINYQNKIVAFVDVLGFSNIVYSETTDLIDRYFKFILDDFKFPVKNNRFNYHLISDSIVISANNNKNNLSILIELLCMLQSKLMIEGILLRGGISFGNLYLNKSNSVIVGPGLINAYKLEAKAIYPRIILDRRFIPQYFDNTTSAITFTKNKMFNLVLHRPPIPYTADFLYINYTRYFSAGYHWHKLQKVIDLFKANYYKNEYVDKYEWLRVHLFDSMNQQITYLNESPIKTITIRKRLRLITRFLKEFQKL